MKPHIFIGTPMYGGMCSGQFTRSMIILLIELDRRGYAFNFLFRYNESLITRGRNALVANFLETEATHLLFIDADIGFDAEQVLRMIEADKDIICGIYPNKSINWDAVKEAAQRDVPASELHEYTGNWVVNMVDYKVNEKVSIDKPFEIWNGGTGMMLIKRNVFEVLKDKVPSYKVNEKDPLMQKHFMNFIPEYFATSIDPQSQVLLSEDYHFCRLWREAGGTVWAAPWMELDHIGTYVFNGRPIRGEQK